MAITPEQQSALQSFLDSIRSGFLTKANLDALDSRAFYEMCQAYRWSPLGAEEFEALKDWIRRNSLVCKTVPDSPHEEDRT